MLSFSFSLYQEVIICSIFHSLCLFLSHRNGSFFYHFVPSLSLSCTNHCSLSHTLKNWTFLLSQELDVSSLSQELIIALLTNIAVIPENLFCCAYTNHFVFKTRINTDVVCPFFDNVWTKAELLVAFFAEDLNILTLNFILVWTIMALF